MSLVRSRCFVHASREAVARCLTCGRSYCKECVTEHDGRLHCARCLATAAQLQARRRHRREVLGRLLVGTTWVLAALGSLYWMTRSLGELPSSFHDGSLWVEKDKP